MPNFLSLIALFMDNVFLFFCRYLFTTELDLPHNVVYEVMKPPKTTEERLKWDKSLKHYACLESVREVSYFWLFCFEQVLRIKRNKLRNFLEKCPKHATN